MNKIDMHVHTFNSDGELSITGVLLKAYIDNVKKIVLTDHNIIQKDNIYRNIVPRFGIEYMMGTEISTSFKGVHILGYGDRRFLGLNELLKSYENLKKEYLKRAVREMKKKDIDISLTDFIVINKELFKKAIEKDSRFLLSNNLDLKTMSRNNGISQYEINGLFSDNLSIQNLTYLIKQKGLDPEDHINYGVYRDNCLSPRQAIELIHSFGGVAILAHPQTVGNGEYESFVGEIKKIRDYGIDGYELSSKLDPDQIYYLKRDKKMIFTLGSDFHYINQTMGVEDTIDAWDKTKELIKKR